MDRYSDTDNRKGREQLRLNLHPPRQISTLLRTGTSRLASPNNITPNSFSHGSIDQLIASKGAAFARHAFCCLTMPMAAHFVVDSNE